MSAQKCPDCTPSELGDMLPSDLEWQPIQFSAEPQGKLCYFLSSPCSHLPVRDILGQQKRGCKLEPHLETQTYNLCAACNSRHVGAAVKAGFRYLFFVTRYKGKLVGYREHYMIVGYYELDGWTSVADRQAVHALRIKFVAAKDAFLVTPEVCREWGITHGNLRYLTQRVEGARLERLLDHLQAAPDATPGYLKEIERLNESHSSQRRLSDEDR